MGSIQIYGKTAAQWASANPVLLARQPATETDTNRLKFGDGVTAWNELPYFSGTAAETSELLTGGIITVETIDGTGTLNDIRVTASTYYIVGSGNHSAVETTFLNIALSSAGTERFIDIYATTSNTIIKVEGTEGSLATHPADPGNAVLIGYLLVNDASVSGTPDLSGYLLKADKATAADVLTGTNDTKYLTSLSVRDKGRDIQFGYAGTFSPADSSTYYLGGNPALNPIATNPNGREIPITKTGTIIAAGLFIWTNTTIGSAEPSSFYVDVFDNTGSVIPLSSNLISAAITWNGTGRKNSFNITGLSIPVVAGQNISIRMVTPAWATNPTNTWAQGALFVT